MLMGIITISYFTLCFLTCLIITFTFKRIVKESQKKNILLYFFMFFYFLNSLISNYIIGIRSYYSLALNLIFFPISIFLSKKFRIYGITGQIASGKSTVSQYLREKYMALVIDLDKINSEVLESPQVKGEIRKVFGDAVFDDEGKLKKLEMRKIIFSDKIKKKKLEKITHMKVLMKLIVIIFKEKILNSKRLIFIENAILLKVPILRYLCHTILAVIITIDEIKIKRVMNRDNIKDKNLVDKILENQTTVEEFNKQADFIIVNDEDLEKLYYKTDFFVKTLEN